MIVLNFFVMVFRVWTSLSLTFFGQGLLLKNAIEGVYWGGTMGGLTLILLKITRIVLKKG